MDAAGTRQDNTERTDPCAGNLTAIDTGAAREPLHQAVARGMAAFLGVFCLLNAIGEMRRRGFDATIWWLDLRPLGSTFILAFTTLLGFTLCGFAVRPRMCWPRRCLTLLAVGFAFYVAISNTLDYFTLVGRGTISPAAPLPISLLVAGTLALVLGVCGLRGDSVRRGRRRVIAGSAVVMVFATPLVQMYGFGRTDYRRPADAVVVFGARVYADGQISGALHDRVRTASELVVAGYARTLIVSGGPGDGVVHETEAMARLAESLGVPPEAILRDPDGRDTQATADHVTAMLRERGGDRLLAVSHGYHLPRVKLAFQRAGREVYTVPAFEAHTLRKAPYYLAREVAAQWAYFLGPLVS